MLVGLTTYSYSHRNLALYFASFLICHCTCGLLVLVIANLGSLGKSPPMAEVIRWRLHPQAFQTVTRKVESIPLNSFLMIRSVAGFLNFQRFVLRTHCNLSKVVSILSGKFVLCRKIHNMATTVRFVVCVSRCDSITKELMSA